MTRNAVSTTRLYQLVFGLAFLFICYGAVRTMMFGTVTNAKQVAFFFIVVAVALWLDRLYWLMLPLCLALNLTIPGFPFDTNELGCIFLIVMFFIRSCLHRDAVFAASLHVLPTLPLFFWICMVWAMNPAGMNLLGSSSMGGRFYFKVLFGYGALYCLSKLRLTESDCRILLRVLLTGALLSVLALFLNTGLQADSEAEPENTTHYSFLAFVGVYQLIWASHSLPEILSSLKLFALTSFSALCIASSGKRSSTASIVLIPIYRILLTGKNLGSTLVVVASSFIVLSFLVAMDGHYINLPYAPKRALAMVFSKYRNQGFEGTHDVFRKELAAQAREIIREHPWIGRGGFKLDSETMSWLVGSKQGGMFGGHAYSGSWHSAFYAFPADFGIPCLAFYLFFLYCCIGNVVRTCRREPIGAYRHACLLYYGFLLLHVGVSCIYTSGHSSKTTMYMMLHYGMFLAVSNRDAQASS